MNHGKHCSLFGKNTKKKDLRQFDKQELRKKYSIPINFDDKKSAKNQFQDSERV